MSAPKRLPAYPLMTVDPYFSVWSMGDHFYDGPAKHWTGRNASLYCTLTVDGKKYDLACCDHNHVNRAQSVRRLRQTSVRVTPLSTTYAFDCPAATLKLRFVTPLLLDRLDILTRPVSYVEYEVARKDGKTGGTSLQFGISAELCVNYGSAQVKLEKTAFSMSAGNVQQNVLSEVGDSVLINWGHLHLCDENAYAAPHWPPRRYEDGAVVTPYVDNPYLLVDRTDAHGIVTVAYDEGKAIEYFGQQVDEYSAKFFPSFEAMVAAAKAEAPAILELCDAFDEQLMDEAKAVSEDYCALVSLAYRQAIAAHKLIEVDGEVLFLSKEDHSNGCIGTMDVTYPSIPLFLKYNPELVLGMLRPILKFAQSAAWPYGFAPHDVGTYPKANGQVYGLKDGVLLEDKQMPVEESGNMLLCVAAAAKYSGSKAFFEENKVILKQWADYLVEYGYDPGNQLCTDDFAGHLAHNCNLSIKAILGIAAYGALSGEKKYMDIAAQYAKRWERDAKNAHGTRLVFDKEEGWSLKYNMVWDDLLGYKLFSDEVKQGEIALYKAQLNRYGVPLDSRADYTKLDWLLWTTCLWRDKEYTDAVLASVMTMLEETSDRVPLTDWYDTKNAFRHAFQNRSVVGGVFINLLK